MIEGHITHFSYATDQLFLDPVRSYKGEEDDVIIVQGSALILSAMAKVWRENGFRSLSEYDGFGWDYSRKYLCLSYHPLADDKVFYFADGLHNFDRMYVLPEDWTKLAALTPNTSSDSKDDNDGIHYAVDPVLGHLVRFESPVGQNGMVEINKACFDNEPYDVPVTVLETLIPMDKVRAGVVLRMEAESRGLSRGLIIRPPFSEDTVRLTENTKRWEFVDDRLLLNDKILYDSGEWCSVTGYIATVH